MALKVLHSTQVWLPQTQTWMYSQVAHIPERIEPHVVCVRSQNLDQFGVKHLHVSGTTTFLGRTIQRLLGGGYWDQYHRFLVRTAKRVGGQVLHSHFGNVGWFNVNAAHSAALKHIVTFYGYDVNFLPKTKPEWNARYRQLFDQVNGVLCEGTHMGRCLQELGCPQEKIRVFHLGIDTKKIAYHPRSWNRDVPLKVLIAASFQEKKGIPYALQALGKLKGEVAIQITVIGDASGEERSQAEKGRIMAAVQQGGIEEDVTFLGYQSHEKMLELAYDHHVFLSPSVTADDGDTEGGAPVSIIEMAATGMPVVSTKHCDIPEVLDGGKAGLLAEERDVDGLVERLRWLVENPGSWRTFAEAARFHIEAEYDVVKQGERLAQIYEEVAREASG